MRGEGQATGETPTDDHRCGVGGSFPPPAQGARDAPAPARDPTTTAGGLEGHTSFAALPERARVRPRAKPIDVDRVREAFDLNPDTGVLTRRQSRGGVPAGSPAGTAGPEGRVIIGFDGQLYRRARLVWAHHHGVDPGHQQIDHINRDPSDDRPANLRLATHGQNGTNAIRPRRRPEQIGLPPCVRLRPSGRYEAAVSINGRMINRSGFRTIADAEAAARAIRAARVGGEEWLPPADQHTGPLPDAEELIAPRNVPPGTRKPGLPPCVHRNKAGTYRAVVVINGRQVCRSPFTTVAEAVAAATELIALRNQIRTNSEQDRAVDRGVSPRPLPDPMED